MVRGIFTPVLITHPEAVKSPEIPLLTMLAIAVWNGIVKVKSVCPPVDPELPPPPHADRKKLVETKAKSKNFFMRKSQISLLGF
jgi:hypothetical protein